MHSDGRGLLVDDGVSVSNLFTGDAPTAYVTMSAVGRSQETRESRRSISQFLGSPAGFTQASRGPSARSSANGSSPRGPSVVTSDRASTAAGKYHGRAALTEGGP